MVAFAAARVETPVTPKVPLAETLVALTAAKVESPLTSKVEAVISFPVIEAGGVKVPVTVKFPIVELAANSAVDTVAFPETIKSVPIFAVVSTCKICKSVTPEAVKPPNTFVALKFEVPKTVKVESNLVAPVTSNLPSIS